MKVLILSCNTGEGHNSAARAIYEELCARNIRCKRVDALRIAGEKLSRNISTAYSTIVTRAPKAFGAIYKAGELFNATKITSPVYYANAAYAKKMHCYIAKNDFDMIITTHLFPMEALSWLKRKGKLSAAPCYGVLTDYTYIPFWNETKMDGYFLPTETIKHEYISKGMDVDTLHVTGLPVSGRFINQMTKKEARKYLAIPDNKKMYLIMTGGIGCGNSIELCGEVLMSQDDDISVYVLVGRNSKLKEKLNAKYNKDSRVYIVTFTDIVNIYMLAADVLISKAGGISSTEAAVCNLPIVHSDVIPGCESQNAAFFEKFGMSFYAHDIKEAAEYAHVLVNDDLVSKKMIAAQKKYITPYAARNIVDFIIKKHQGQL